MATSIRTVTITAERVTREAFAPFGELISTDGIEPLQRPGFYGDGSELYVPAVLESDQPVEFLLRRSSIRDFRIRYLERHLQLTQTFIPLAGHPFIAVVARPDAREEHEIPAVDEIHAFFVPGDAGVNLHRGTWHEPPFPLVDNCLTLFTSHRALTQGLQSALNERREVDQLDVEKRNLMERAHLEALIALPQ
jgi:ureidoglycolate lyase